MQRPIIPWSGRLARWIAIAGLCVAAAACETPGEVATPSVQPEVAATQLPKFPLPVPRPPRPEIAAKSAAESAAGPGGGPDLRDKARPAEHTVRSGEDIYQIAAMYGLDAYLLATSNGLTPPFNVTAGQHLKLPPTEAQLAAAAQPSSTAEPTTGEGEGAAGEPQAPTTPQPEGNSETAAATPAPKPPAPPESVQEEGFIWPVSGEVISEFGPKGNGLFNDGINIAASRGAPVRAAESGVVAYAGNELRGFGNMLLIKHTDGWVTAYAHADELMVSKGERVSKGQVIARVGSSGSVTSPQLHFEMRRRKKPVDPLLYLRRSAA